MEPVSQVNTNFPNMIKTLLRQHLLYFLKSAAEDNPIWKELNRHIQTSILMYSSHELVLEDLWLRRKILLHYTAVLRQGFIFIRVINATGRPAALMWTTNENKEECIQVLRPGQNCLVVGSEHFYRRWAARYLDSNSELSFVTQYCSETKELILRLSNDLYSLKDICIDVIRTKISINFCKSNLPVTLINEFNANKNVEPVTSELTPEKSPKVLRFHPWAVVNGNPYALRAESPILAVWHCKSYSDELHELIETLKYYDTP